MRDEGLRGLAWILASLGIAVVPHVPYLPAWVTLLLLAVGAWRWAAQLKGWPLPARGLRLGIVFTAAAGVLATYRTINGVEAGTAFLVLMATVKLLETRSLRDVTILAFIAWFLLYAALLRDQGLLQLPWLAGSAYVTTIALMKVHAGRNGLTTRQLATRSGALLLQALPLALLLFLLFPRLPGPFWGIDSGRNARAGLSETMSPGDVSELSLTGAVAFRARFIGSLPRPEQRYWRGPVLHEFDGRSWRRPQAQAFPEQAVQFNGAPLEYELTLEPHGRRWILALDLPAHWPEREAVQAYDFTLLAPRAINNVANFKLSSYPRYEAGSELSASLRHKDLSLPDDGSNPRAVALGRELNTRYAGNATAITRAMLQIFRAQPYFYTLQPPRLADNAVDEFLFETRKGFCEHYASAFTVVMRAAGIPARVVTGYQGGEFNPYGGYLIVRQSDAHAWSEVWVQGRGWTRIDPTAAVAPERIQGGLIRAMSADEPVPGRLRDASNLWLQVELSWDAVNDFWNQRVVRFDAQSQFDLLERLGIEEPDWRALGLGLAVSLAIFFAALTTYLGWTRRSPDLDWPARLHAVAARRLQKRGLVQGRAEGPVAFLARAHAACPDLAEQLDEIRHLYAALRYGPSPSGRDLQRLKYAVNALRP